MKPAAQGPPASRGVELVASYLAEVGLHPDCDVDADSLLVDNLGLDSLHLIELAFYCAEVLGVGSAPEEPPIFETVGDVDRYLEVLNSTAP